MLGNWPSDLAGQRRAWKKVAVQKEFNKQAAMIEVIGAMIDFDEQTVARLRSNVGPAKTLKRKSRAKSSNQTKRGDDDSIEAWCVNVRRHLNRSEAHRTAFVAALAERLLPFYLSFAANTGKGRPELLRDVLNEVWQAAKGRPFSRGRFEELQMKLHQAAVDAKELEAWSAWSAWRILELALAC